MGIEDEDVYGGSTTAYTRYGLGARGIDFMEKVTCSTTVTAYPIYDAHGNMVATLQRSGTNSYTFGDQRSYDAWGKVRSGSGTGDPKGTYCASLGHKQDDESGFVYMGARYYEPTSGRFASEDIGKQGVNLFAYCANDPVGHSDPTGTSWFECQEALFAAFCSAMESGLPVEQALARFVTQAVKDITHYAAVEMYNWMQLMSTIASNEFMSNTIAAGIPWVDEETTDALQSRASQHFMEAKLIKIFGPAEMLIYSLMIELSDPFGAFGG